MRETSCYAHRVKEGGRCYFDNFRGETPKEPSQAGLIVLSSQRRSLSRPDDDLRTTQAGRTGRTKDEHVHGCLCMRYDSLGLNLERRLVFLPGTQLVQSASQKVRPMFRAFASHPLVT